MSNELTLPPEAFADDGADFSAEFLLFDGKRGCWTRGRDKDETPVGTRCVALVDEQLRGFVRFDDGRPRSRLLPIWPTPDLRALRASLGDLDEALWLDRDAKGNPQDPWRPARRLPVIVVADPVEGLIYSTSSFGGIKAVSALGRAVLMRRREDVNALPLVSLGADSYVHPGKTFGRIFSPLLDIDGWTTHRAVEEMMRTGKPLPAPAPRIEAEPARAPKATAQTTRRAAKEAEGAPWEESDRTPEAAKARLEQYRSRRRS
jgi:hypothetical protein